MSTYGTAVVVDSPHAVALGEAASRLAAENTDVYRSTLPDGWTRVVVWVEDINQVHRFSTLLSHVGTGRAVVAEDNDEFGAAWTVLFSERGLVRTVHRRYVLNADPTDPADVAAAIEDQGGVDPRGEDVAGDLAAAAAAALFGVDPSAMGVAEALVETEPLVDGSVGGPFPWWDALSLTWPGPDAGVPVAPAVDTPKPVRINRATWPRFAARHVVPHLSEPEDWTVTQFGALRGSPTWLARGVAWAPASGDWFQAFAFVAALYVPDVGVPGNWSTDLTDYRGRRGFDLPSRATMERIGADLARSVTEHGLEHLDRIGDLQEFAAMLTDRQASVEAETGFTGAYAEELGYTLLLLGRDHDAMAQLDDASIVDPNAAAEWDLERARRAAMVARLLANKRHDALNQLDDWAQQSADTLGIQRTAER